MPQKPFHLLISDHVLIALQSLPENSVHAVVTSPPYWGLRAYDSDPVIWGETSPCAHLWEDTSHKNPNASGGPTRKQVTNPGSFTAGYSDRTYHHETCVKCGAWLGHLGMEPTPELYVQHLVEVFQEIRRVLRPEGTLWLNLGDSYASGRGYRDYGSHDGYVRRGSSGGQRPTPAPGIKPKDLVGIPWRLFFALQADGWYGRCDVVESQTWICPCGCGHELELDRVAAPDLIWQKPAPMPDSVTDRPTRSHEYLFILSPSERYYYDRVAIQEPFADERQGRDYRGWDTRERNPSERNRGGRTDGYTNNHIDPSHNGGRNKRSVWSISSEPFGWGLCRHCLRIYDAAEMRRLPKSGQDGDRNRKRICTCGRHDGWLSHYAAYSTKLVKPCLLASVSSHGCCSECGAPYRRLTTRHRENRSNAALAGTENISGVGHPSSQVRENHDVRLGPVVLTSTDGWAPTCECPSSSPVASTVLDPFSGTGTTGLTALGLGHNYIGIDNSRHYQMLAAERFRRKGF